MLCARDAHMFKPFGRHYCTVHPSYSHSERTLPTSDCPTITIAPASVRTLKEDTGGDHPKVTIELSKYFNKNIIHIVFNILTVLFYCIVSKSNTNDYTIRA